MSFSPSPRYLVRTPKTTSSQRPIIFLHGLGLGVLQYHSLIKTLIREFPTRPILIPLQPHISQDLFHPRFLKPLGRHETIDCLLKVIKEHRWEEDGVDVLSHSKYAACLSSNRVLTISQWNICPLVGPESFPRAYQEVLLC